MGDIETRCEDVAKPLTEREARALLVRVNDTVQNLTGLINRLWEGRGWEALGYASWDEMCRAEVRTPKLARDQRQELVVEFRNAGMSTRAIGSALGVGDATVRRDISTASDDAVDLPETVTGLDGKERAARKPAIEPVNVAALDIGPAQVVNVDGMTLVRALAAVEYARSKDASRPILTGVSISTSDDGATLRLVATDSYRLHLVEIPGEFEPGITAIFRPPDLKSVRALIDRWTSPDVTVAIGSDTYTMSSDIGLPFHGHVIKGDFPAWWKLLPDSERPSEIPVTWNASHLVDIGNAAQAFLRGIGGTDYTTNRVTVTQCDPQRSTVFKVQAPRPYGHRDDPVAATLTMLLMPVKVQS